MTELAEPPKGFTFIKGEPIDFEKEFEKGKTVFVLEFWATWCPPCRSSIPQLTQLQQKYKSKDVVFVGITSEDASKVAPFVNQMGSKMDYTVVLDSAGDAASKYTNRFGIRGIPHAFIVGRDGKVIGFDLLLKHKIAWHGHPMEGEFENNLSRCANEPPKVSIDVNQPREDLMKLSAKDLKAFLASKGIDSSQCIEKSELVDLIKEKCT